MINILITISIISIMYFGSAKDGLSNRLDGVSWINWHKFGWLSRDIPIAILYLILILNDQLWIVVLLLVLHSNQNNIYMDYNKNRQRYFGDPEPPEWFFKIRKLWSWLPWVK